MTNYLPGYKQVGTGPLVVFLALGFADSYIERRLERKGAA